MNLGLFPGTPLVLPGTGNTCPFPTTMWGGDPGLHAEDHRGPESLTLFLSCHGLSCHGLGGQTDSWGLC